MLIWPREEDYLRFLHEGFEIESSDGIKNIVTINVEDENINILTRKLVGYKIKYFKENKYSLEKYFKSLY